jgi:hypothetical protein
MLISYNNTQNQAITNLTLITLIPCYNTNKLFNPVPSNLYKNSFKLKTHDILLK